MRKVNITVLSLMVCLLLSVAAEAQKQKKSPKATTRGTINGANIEIVYHQPSARGRKVMGELVPFGQVWRTGANNATTFMVDKDIKVEGKALPKGTYALFTIPGEKQWTIIFNKNANQWGAFNYDKAEDALRVDVKAKKADDYIETFKIWVNDEDVLMGWENTEVKFKVED